MKLTQATAAILKLPKGKQDHIEIDDDLPGFGLRLREGGARTWTFQYKIGKQHRRLTLGHVAALTATKARATAAELHAKVRLGRDPAGERADDRLRAGETVGAHLSAYLEVRRKGLRPRSYSELARYLLKAAKPLHGLQLAKIDRRAVASLITKVADTSGPAAANQTRATLSAFFAWGMREGLTETNPVANTNRQPAKARTRILSDVELRAIWTATATASDYHSIVRLLMLTGQRANEIGALRWSEIHGDEIILSAARTKNGRGHIIPVTSAVRAILDARQPRDGDDFVFGSRPGVPFTGWSACKSVLDQRMRDMCYAVEGWVHHDLRRTLATRLGDLDVPPHVTESLLNHVSGSKGGVAGIYNRGTYEPQKRIALERWARRLVEEIANGKPRKANKVVSLRG